MTVANNAPNSTLIGVTSNPIAAYRKGLNSETWGLAKSTVTNADPESLRKLNPSLWSQARGILPNMIIVPQLNMDMMTGSYYSTPNGSRLQRANLQVSFIQSQL
jgi:hypothetical protein